MPGSVPFSNYIVYYRVVTYAVSLNFYRYGILVFAKDDFDDVSDYGNDLYLKGSRIFRLFTEQADFLVWTKTDYCDC